jgi:hypothetical protein
MITSNLSHVVAELAAARRALAFCIAQRGTLTNENDRMALTIGELDWIAEVMRLGDLLRKCFQIRTGMEWGVVSPTSRAGNVLLPGCDDHATMTARSRRPTLFPSRGNLMFRSQIAGQRVPDSEAVNRVRCRCRAMSPTPRATFRTV